MRKLQTTYRGSDDHEGFWTKPKSITSEERSKAIAYLRAAREINPPAPEAWLKGRIATLLSHYYLATNDVNINTAVAIDWVDCLRPFPQVAVEKACAEWRDTERRKPTPADIRGKAIATFGSIEWTKLMRLKALIELPIVDSAPKTKQQGERILPTPEQKMKVAKMVAISAKFLSGAKMADLTEDEQSFCRENRLSIKL